MSKPLSGIRVLDLSRVLAGPWATQLLADLGAEVIKIEKPGTGDDTRSWGPPFLNAGDENALESAYFLCANRGKKSVAIDLSSPQGASLIRRIAESCDVVIENFKVGGLTKYGLDSAALQQANPMLIYCSITGYGQTGPSAQKPGYDFVIQGSAGLMSVTGDPDGGPLKAGVALVDILTGLYAANAIQAALIERARTGVGKVIDMALQDVLVAVMANQALNFLCSGVSPGRLGNAHPNIVPYQAFSTLDGMLTVAVGNDGQFSRMCEAVGHPDLSKHPSYQSNRDRVANRETLIPALVSIFEQQSTAHWLEKLDGAGVPCGPVNSMEQVFADPQVLHRGLAITVEHATLVATPGVRCPIRFVDGEDTLASSEGAPTLGQHTDEVLKSLLNLSQEHLNDLAAEGVLSGR